MAWQVRITKTAEKQIARLEKSSQKRIIKFLKDRVVAANPRQTGKALHGNKIELWRYRVGDYRLICSIDDELLLIIILEVGHRREIYRKKH